MLAFWRRLRAPLGGSSIAYTAAGFVGVFVLELLFVVSYAGGLHKPAPRDVPVAVVAPAAQAARLQAVVAPEIRILSEPDEAAARAAIDDRKAYGAFVPPNRLVVSEAPSPYTEQIVLDAARKVASAQGVTLSVETVHRLPPSDPRGYTAFYLALGLVVGGYLVGILGALARGSTPATRRLALLRLAGLALYSLASGVAAAVLIGPVMGLLHGHLAALIGIGTLLVFATAAATLALEALLGILGTGLAIVAFVILANPASGGPFPRELLTEPWRSAGPWLPTGAGTDAFRNTLYFAGHATLVPLLVLGAYALVGAALVVALGGVGLSAASDPRPASPRTRGSSAPASPDA